MNGQGQRPAGFDAAACPIIARHFYGLRPIVTAFRRKHAADPLSLGPGELARACELRKRGLHLRLIEAWRPHPTHLKTERTKLMTEQELTSLRTIVRYLWRDEQQNFAECQLNDGVLPDDHVFAHLETLSRYLTRAKATDVSPFI